jgi:hypothetical protein
LPHIGERAREGVNVRDFDGFAAFEKKWLERLQNQRKQLSTLTVNFMKYSGGFHILAFNGS